MAIHIIVVAPESADILIDGHPLAVVRLLDHGRPSERVDAAVARAASAWNGRDMPPAALLPDGRLIRWEPGLLHAADADLQQFPALGRVSASEPPVLLREDGPPWTRADAVAAAILDAEGNFAPWRRPRIEEIVSVEVTPMPSPNPGSSGPVIRQFATISVRLDDGSTGTLAAYWHVPDTHLAEAEVALPGLPLTDAHEWLSEPLRRRVEADARVLCAGGPGLDLRCGDVRLRLEPAPGGEILMLEGIAGHALAAGPAAAGERAALLGGELAAAGGSIRFDVLGLAVIVVLEATGDGGLRVRCQVNGTEEVVGVSATGVRAAIADVAGYLEALGDQSVAADGGVRVEVPGFGR